MNTLQVKVPDGLDQQIIKYAGLKKINKSQAIRELITAGIDITANENEIIKEIKSLKSEIRDNHTFNKKGFDRLAALSVKNGIKIFSIWHAILIQVFLRSKDKNLDDSFCVTSKDEVAKTALSYGISEFNAKSES